MKKTMQIGESAVNSKTRQYILDVVPEFRVRLELIRAVAFSNIFSRDCIELLLQYLPDLRRKYSRAYIQKTIDVAETFCNHYIVNDLLQMSRILSECPEMGGLHAATYARIKVFEYESKMYTMVFVYIIWVTAETPVMMYFSGTKLIKYLFPISGRIRYVHNDVFALTAGSDEHLRSFSSDVCERVNIPAYGQVILPCGRAINSRGPTDDFGKMYKVSGLIDILPFTSSCRVVQCE